MKNVATPPAEIVFDIYIQLHHTLLENNNRVDCQKKWLNSIKYDWNIERGGIKGYLKTLNQTQLKHCLNSLYEIFR